MDEGPCKSIQPRFYFDIDTQKCEPFDYGGCQGNENKFNTLADCEEMCLVERGKDPCQLEEEPGPCRLIIIRYFFSTISQKSLNVPDFCLTPAEEGSCAASVKRYFYNSTQEKCQQFVYSGCGGNNNNFISKKDCRKTCMKGVCRKVFILIENDQCIQLFSLMI
ncbi:UNVERIFIED_CONTAM: hypothetical protein FKN15_028178 [Acipenser sinensis]